MSEPRKRYAVYLCDPTPWERGHTQWRVPEFFPLITSLSPDAHGPWVLPHPQPRPWLGERIFSGYHDQATGTGHHNQDYFERRRYWTYRKEKALQQAAKIRAKHPHLIVRVDEIP